MDDEASGHQPALSGSVPGSFTFGDGIDWSSELVEVYLYVELPFWLMIAPGSVDVVWSGTRFSIQITSPWKEVYAAEVTGSKRTVVFHGPATGSGWKPPADVADAWAREGVRYLERPTKTLLRLPVRGHLDACREIGDDEPPRARVEHEAYWASLCEAHLPVVNELIQRYRLATYDYFAYEVSAWDVPVWWLKHRDVGWRAVLMPYADWDRKPARMMPPEQPGGPPTIRPFEFTTVESLDRVASTSASAGEFDLLDARSLMERGDYTGAVRRTVTAIEALLRAQLVRELSKTLSLEDAEAKARATDNDFPGRLRQWRRIAKPSVPEPLFDDLERTRRIRHDIVHRGRRLTHQDRGEAQRAVDTGRWLYNRMEGDAERARLRDRDTLKSVGRVALTPRFPAVIDESGITLRSI